MIDSPASKRKLPWFSESYAKKLKKLHAWNAWLVLLLAVTGVLLFIPEFRTAFPQVRLWTKQLHIILGIISLIPIALYLPLIVKHMKQISRKAGQTWNLRIVLFILAGWIVSGLILWQHRQFPPALSNAALLWHDLFTWVGLPYILFHSITRMKWVKRADFRPSVEHVVSAEEGAITERLRAESRRNRPSISRRLFIKAVIGFLAVLTVAPSFTRWLRGQLESGGTGIVDFTNQTVPNNDSQMIPPPQPLADSSPPIGGGAKGNFRIYTVTDMPTSRAETWSFEISGLVDQNLSYNWDQFMALPREVRVDDFHCVTGWSVYSCTWEGIKVSALLELAGVKPNATTVKFYSGDGVYTDTLTMDQAMMDEVLVVSMLDGKPIPKKLGGPVRLVVPSMYAYKSVKWLQAIELIDRDEDGYWIVRGYPKDAWIPGRG